MTASPTADDLAYEEPDQVRHQLRQLWRHRLAIATGLVIGVCGGVGVHAWSSASYAAQGSMVLQAEPSSPAGQGTAANDQVTMQTEVQVAGSPLVADRAAKALREPGVTGADLRHGLSVAMAPDSQILQFTYTDAHAAEAAERANALMKAYLAQRQATAKAGIAISVKALQGELKTLDGRYGEAPAGSAQRDAVAGQITAVQTRLTDYQGLDTTPGRILAPATAPAQPSGMGGGLTAALGGVVGLAAGILVAWLLSVLDPAVRDAEDVRRHLGAPVLATLPGTRRLLPGGGPAKAVGARPSRLGEAYRALALRVALTSGGTPDATGRRVLLVVEPRATGDSAEVAVNLAAAFAENGEDVLLIEADLRRPHLAARLEGSITGDGTGPDGRPLPPLRVDAGQPGGFFFVPGRRTRGVSQALAEIEANAVAHRGGRTIVVCAPAVLDYPDALAVARWADGVIVACPARGQRRDELGRVREFLAPSGTPLLGAVLRPSSGGVVRRARREASEPGGGHRAGDTPVWHAPTTVPAGAAGGGAAGPGVSDAAGAREFGGWADERTPAGHSRSALPSGE